MSELREDPLTGRRVLIAENRAGRPNEFAASVEAPPADPSPRADCVFCVGNESQTPNPSLELLDADGQWQVRAFANKYPALDAEAGQGVHEVIVESRSHCQRTGQLSVEQLALVLHAYALRLDAVDSAGDGCRLIFKNVGASAGASLSHLHSQLITLPYAWWSNTDEVGRYSGYRFKDGRCPWCERIAQERREGVRLVDELDGFVALCPNASRQPFETMILPVEHAVDRHHNAQFERLVDSGARLTSLATLLRRVVRAIEGEIVDAGYNLIVLTAPPLTRGAGYWHWRIEIVPRVSSFAGLELATGLFLNTLSPERAAARLRERIAGDKGTE